LCCDISPSRGHLQSSLALICRWPGHLSLARFGPLQRTATLDSIARQVLTPLPAAYSSARVCAYTALRFPSLPTALRNIAPMLPVVGCGTRSAYGITHSFLHRRRSGSLSLSQVWRTNEGHRTAHRCRDPTSLSATDQLCGMKLLSPTPTLRALLRATPLSASSKNEFLHAASSTTVFTIPFHPSHFLGPGVTGHAPRRSFGAQNHPFPQLNLHRARVRRNHGRPPPNGFTGRARSSSPPFTTQRERASGKALAFLASVR
jgi:hypothetical protein